MKQQTDGSFTGAVAWGERGPTSPVSSPGAGFRCGRRAGGKRFRSAESGGERCSRSIGVSAPKKAKRKP